MLIVTTIFGFVYGYMLRNQYYQSLLPRQTEGLLLFYFYMGNLFIAQIIISMTRTRTRVRAQVYMYIFTLLHVLT